MPELAANDARTLTRAHVIKLNPNRIQEEYFRRACGIRRFTYNWALSQWEAWWELYKEEKITEKEKEEKSNGSKDPSGEESKSTSIKYTAKKVSIFGNEVKRSRPGWQDMSKFFNGIKKFVVPFVLDVSSRIPERAIKDAGTAYSNWFKAMQRGDTNWGRPQRAKWGVNERFYVHNGSLRFEGKLVNIEKCGKVRCYEKFRFENSKILAGQISQKADGWYLAVQCEVPVDKIKQHKGEEVGIDLGISINFALSDKTHFNLPHTELKAVEKKIKRAQKVLSKRWSGKPKKGHEEKALRDDAGKLLKKSNRFLHAKKRLALLKQKDRRIRENALHQISKFIVEKYSIIYIEDLKIKNMTASAKGDEETPGKNVRAKAGLNRELLKVAMHQFRWLLEYKSEETGAKIIPVNPAYTSQRCSQCGHQEKENRKTQADFICQKCDFQLNADMNAAINILKDGQKFLKNKKK